MQNWRFSNLAKGVIETAKPSDVERNRRCDRVQSRLPHPLRLQTPIPATEKNKVNESNHFSADRRLTGPLRVSIVFALIECN
jgi:hypothetical protein